MRKFKTFIVTTIVFFAAAALLYFVGTALGFTAKAPLDVYLIFCVILWIGLEIFIAIKYK